MVADYIEVAFTLPRPGNVRQDLLIAGLGEAGYESFLETEAGFNAYIRADDFSEQSLKLAMEEAAAIVDHDTPVGETGEMPAFAYEIRLVKSQNWNQVWESNFQPVTIGDQCRIRASFHIPDPAFPLEIQIDPKMSFGTGHHETTWLMASWLLELARGGKLAGKKVLDMGCGTGVLAIVAAKKGATDVLAVDIDPVCVENTLENANLNQVMLNCRKSDIDGIGERGFDLILANINRNVLLDHLPFYAERLEPGGTLLLSGFYEGSDVEAIQEKAAECSLTCFEVRSRHRWAAALFKRKTSSDPV